MSKNKRPLLSFDKASLAKLEAGMSGINPFAEGLDPKTLPHEGYIVSPILRRNGTMRFIFNRFAGIEFAGKPKVVQNGAKSVTAKLARAGITTSEYQIEPDMSIASVSKAPTELLLASTQHEAKLCDLNDPSVFRRERIVTDGAGVLSVCHAFLPAADDGPIIAQPWFTQHVEQTLQRLDGAFAAKFLSQTPAAS